MTANGSPPTRRIHRTPIVLALTAALSVALTFTLVDPWLDGAGILAGGFDLHIYRDGAWKIAHGHPLYTETTFRGLSYTYTPFSTLIFLPTLAVPWAAVRDTGLVVNLSVLYACVLLCQRILGYRIEARTAGTAALLALTCLFLEPVRSTMYYGQINPVLMAPVLWTFARAADSDRALRGTWIGLAAGIKLVPLYFVAQLVVLRQWRTAVGALLVFAATIVVAAVILPGDSRQYWTSTFFQAGRIAPDTVPANQSVRGVLAHLSHHAVPVWLWVLIAAPVALAGLVVAAEWFRFGESLFAVALAGMTACAVSPFRLESPLGVVRAAARGSGGPSSACPALVVRRGCVMGGRRRLGLSLERTLGGGRAVPVPPVVAGRADLAQLLRDRVSRRARGRDRGPAPQVTLSCTQRSSRWKTGAGLPRYGDGPALRPAAAERDRYRPPL